MKRIRNCIVLPTGLLLLLLFCLPFGAGSQNICGLSISADFEPRCLVTMDKPLPFEELAGELVACQGMTVVYKAIANTGSDPVDSWIWSVAGASAWTDLGGGQISVTWDFVSSGQITLSINTEGGTTCTLTRNVRLIESPTAAAATVPAYHIDANGDKVIYVCEGSDVEFIDQSYTDDKDITGYRWKSFSSTSSTRNYTLRNVLADDEVVHSVYNECGCYDRETFRIVVLQGENLSLNCYGTACQYDVVSYVATNPTCNNYYWSVDGGTIVDGQHTDSLTVQWDRPQNGYGVISLDGILCGGEVCPAMHSRKIPVIHDTVPVAGKTDVCVGEGVVYSVPLWGATEYNWTVVPTSGVSVSTMNGGNKTHIEFNNAGTYTISVVYRCDFLGCGPYQSKTLTVNVKPPLNITGRDKICSGNSCKLTTDAGVAAQWKVYDMATGQQVASSVSAQVFFDRTFPNTGQYRILAEHSSYCAPGEFILTVLDPPPAPVVGDLDQSNPTVACTGSSIKLAATPSTPGYSFVWKPECASASPASASGDDVTINYDNEVCNVKVYNYDRKLECLSTGYYTHNVAEFTLLPHSLPSLISVCPGAEIVFGNDKVPLQDGVLYRWTIEDDKQYCASIIGSALSNTVRIMVNDILPPDAFEITLTRRYCDGEEEVFTITVSVGVAVISQPAIDPISPVCQGELVTLSGTGCQAGAYRWEVDGVTLPGNEYTASTPGVKHVTLMCNPFTFCDNDAYYNSVTSTFTVNPPPLVSELVYNASGYVECRPSHSGSNYSYQWIFDNNVISTGSTALFQGNGTYTLVLVDNNSCTTTYVQYVDNEHITPTVCQELDLTGNSYNYCNNTLTVSVSNPTNNYLLWNVYGNGYTIQSINGNTISVQFGNLGNYTVNAYVEGQPCYSRDIHRFVDFIPDFTYEPQCDAIVVHNNSRYLDGTKTVTIRCDGTDYTFPLSQKTYTIPNLSSSLHTLKLMKYDGTLINGNNGCPAETVNLTPSNHTLSITTANNINPTQTCDNTPILLTAEMSDISTIQSTTWNFGDGSSITRNGGEVYHTFRYDNNLYPPPEFTQYTVTATVKDNIGCDITGSISITSFEDGLIGGTINPITNHPVCPMVNYVTLKYSLSATPTASFQWSYPNGNNELYNVYYTDNYYVRIRDAHYCVVEDQLNVGFLNTPQANIVTERNEYCIGETITLFGAPDPDTTSYTFLWTITSPNNTVVTRNTATAFFTANQTGSYTVRLDISNGSCSDYDIRTIPVGNVPPAPTVAFSTNKCIHTPPVVLSATATATTDMQWSNGNYGHIGRYFSPGVATAYYYDPATGCRSESGSILIKDQPDFDGLLTGCYAQCPSLMSFLPVYGLTTEQQNISWEWYNYNSVIAQGNNVPYSSPLQLPLPYYGEYHLSVNYQGSCNVESPTLSISSLDYCHCDSLDINTKATLDIVKCEVFLDIVVSIVNNSNTAFPLSTFSGLFDNSAASIVSTSFAANSVAPGSTYSFTIRVAVHRFLPAGLKFRIFSIGRDCNADFLIDLLDLVDCSAVMDFSYKINSELSNSVAAYLDFTANITPAQSLLAFWSEPPMVVDYIFDNINSVNGLLMFDIAVLSQLAAAGEDICFYAIVCNNNRLCKYKYCIDAGKLYNAIFEMGLTLQKADKADSQEQEGLSAKNPYLAPNPASNIVSVSGYEGNLVDIVVMDMNGRKVAIHTDTDVFDVSSIPSGTYIVRIRSKAKEEESVCYLKLIKK